MHVFFLPQNQPVDPQQFITPAMGTRRYAALFLWLGEYNILHSRSGFHPEKKEEGEITGYIEQCSLNPPLQFFFGGGGYVLCVQPLGLGV